MKSADTAFFSSHPRCSLLRAEAAGAPWMAAPGTLPQAGTHTSQVSTHFGYPLVLHALGDGLYGEPCGCLCVILPCTNHAALLN